MPNDSRPRSRLAVSTGDAQEESKAFRQCIGRYRWIAADRGMMCAASLVTAPIASAAIAPPIAWSVKVEMATIQRGV